MKARRSLSCREFWWRHEHLAPRMWASARRPVALYRHADASPSTGCSSGLTRASALTIQFIVIARDDDTTFGILHSRFHEAGRCGWAPAWKTARATRPPPPSPRSRSRGPDARRTRRRLRRRPARHRHRRRRPPPRRAARPLAQPARMGRVDRRTRPRLPQAPRPNRHADLQQLKRRTLTNLYNQRPQWLANAHATLDTAVANAYAWLADISDEDALQRIVGPESAEVRLTG